MDELSDVVSMECIELGLELDSLRCINGGLGRLGGGGGYSLIGEVSSKSQLVTQEEPEV